jgi:hypothetical protein
MEMAKTNVNGIFKPVPEAFLEIITTEIKIVIDFTERRV